MPKGSSLPIGICIATPTDGARRRRYGRLVPVITMGEVFARAADDVVERKKVLAMPDGSLTCPKRGRRRNGAIDVHGAEWITTTAKGDIGKIRMSSGMRRLRRKVTDNEE